MLPCDSQTSPSQSDRRAASVLAALTFDIASSITHLSPESFEIKFPISTLQILVKIDTVNEKKTVYEPHVWIQRRNPTEKIQGFVVAIFVGISQLNFFGRKLTESVERRSGESVWFYEYDALLTRNHRSDHCPRSLSEKGVHTAIAKSKKEKCSHHAWIRCQLPPSMFDMENDVDV